MIKLQTIKGHTYSVYCLIKYNGHLYSGSNDNTIIKWNKDGTALETLKGHTGSVICLTEYNGYLYSGSTDNTIKWGQFRLCDYKYLHIEKQNVLMDAAKVFYAYGICKDIRLLIYRCLLQVQYYN